MSPHISWRGEDRSLDPPPSPVKKKTSGPTDCLSVVEFVKKSYVPLLLRFEPYLWCQGGPTEAIIVIIVAMQSRTAHTSS